jgi:hypothetical protein
MSAWFRESGTEIPTPDAGSLRRLSGRINESSIIVTAFQTKEAQTEWSDNVLFKDHLTRIGPLLEGVRSRPCELIFRSEGQRAPDINR